MKYDLIGEVSHKRRCRCCFCWRWCYKVDLTSHAALNMACQHVPQRDEELVSLSTCTITTTTTTVKSQQSSESTTCWPASRDGGFKQLKTKRLSSATPSTQKANAQPTTPTFVVVWFSLQRRALDTLPLKVAMCARSRGTGCGL